MHTQHFVIILPFLFSAVDVSVDDGLQVLLAVAAPEKSWLNFLLHLVHHPFLGLIKETCKVGKGSLRRNTSLVKGLKQKWKYGKGSLVKQLT